MTAAFAGYLAATAGFLVYLVSRRERPARAGLALVGGAFLAHLAAYGQECTATRAMVVTSLHGSFSFLALVTVLVFLVIAVRHQLLILGAFVMPLAAALAGVAAFAPPAPAAVLPMGGPWFPIHVVSTYLGFAGFIAAFGVAVAYLIQERQLKSRHPGAIAFVLPPLDAMDRLMAVLTAASVGIVAIGIGTGMGFAHATTGAWWVAEPKATATLVSWLVYVATLGLRFGAGWRGRRMALLLIAGFILILVTFAGVGHVAPPPSGA